MNKRILLIIALLALLFLVLVFKMQSTQPTATPIVSTPTPAKTPAIILPTMKPVAPGSASSAVAASVSAEPPVSLEEAKNAAAANLHSIAKTFQAYANSGETTRVFTANPGDTAHAAALELARATGLDVATLYFVPGDPKAPNPRPKVINNGDAASPVMNPAFANATLSVEIAANVSSSADVTTTPVAWSRGLQEDGTWAPDSPFGGIGGYLVYADGHVEWYDKISVNEPNGGYFLKYGTNTPTANIREALPPGAVILSAEPNGAQK